MFLDVLQRLLKMAQTNQSAGDFNCRLSFVRNYNILSRRLCSVVLSCSTKFGNGARMNKMLASSCLLSGRLPGKVGC